MFRPNFISNSIRQDPKFTAEVNVYDALKEEIKTLKENLNIYYSCSFVTEKLEPGECDFIIIIPKFGIAFIEVKGGGIAYDSEKNIWSSIDRFQKKHEIKNPALQALKAERYFLELIKTDGFLSNNKINTQYFVCLPNVNDNKKDISPELPNKVTLYHDDITNGLLNKIICILKEKKERQSNYLEIIGPPYMEKLDHLIKPSFVINPSLLTEIESEQKEMLLSDSQIAILKALRYQKKVFIEGCAGTGKTLMAVHRAKEFLKENKKVLILTHSRTLPIAIRQRYFNNEKFENLRIESAFQWTANMARRKNYNSREILDKHKDKQLQFNVGFPELLMHLLDNFITEEDKYDSVIVDEGQRFSDEWWICIDNIKRKNGFLYVFYDPNQTLKNQKTSDFLIEENNNVYPLDLNFRNTKKIFEFNKKLYTGFDIESAGPEGRDPEWIRIKTIEDQNKQITLKIKQLLNEGININDIAIINFGPVGEKGGLQKQFKKQSINIPLDGLESRLRTPYIRYDSVSRFQGLEFPIVILTNFTIDITEHEKNNLYIALTRSSNHLIVITTDEKISHVHNITNNKKYNVSQT